MSEKVLGIIRVQRLTISFRHAAIHEALVFTPNRVFVARVGETPQSGWGATGWMDSVIDVVVYTTLQGIDEHKAREKKRKLEELLTTDLEEFLRADKQNYAIPNSEITKVELEMFGKHGAKIHITTNKKKHKWIVGPKVKGWEGKEILIASKFLENCDNMLRPIFGDKLSVKK